MRRTQTRPEFADPNAVEFSLLESSTVVAAILISADGQLIGANERMRRILGATSETELRGSHVTDFVDPQAWAQWLRTSATGGGELIARLGPSGGPWTGLRGNVTEVAGPAGAAAVCGLFVESTDEQQLRRAVQHSARMEALGSLTTGIAHDFNNLLTVLVGNLYLAAEELRGKSPTFEKVKAARDAGKRGSDLIRQLLAFARREELPAETVDPKKVVADLIPLLNRSLGSRIQLETELDSSSCVRASAAQLESVIVNLAINARDAMAGKGRVALRTRDVTLSAADAAGKRLPKAGAYVAVSVADHGPGIPEEIRERVFEPFFSTKKEGAGTGLGLCMVRWFAEQSGGTVELESVHGRGTTVSVWLPRIGDGVVDGQDGTMPLSTLPSGSENVRVLAADEALRTTIRQILQVLRYAVEFQTRAGLEEASSLDAVRVLIVDEADAEESLLLRALQRGVKVIVTATGAGARERFAGKGTAVLLKPFSIAELAGTVRRLLDAVSGAEPEGR